MTPAGSYRNNWKEEDLTSTLSTQEIEGPAQCVEPPSHKNIEHSCSNLGKERSNPHF
jgi:hypothetical protein